MGAATHACGETKRVIAGEKIGACIRITDYKD